MNLFSIWTFENCARVILEALCVGYSLYDREIVEDPADLWGENTRPSLDMMRAKLVRYSSNLYAMAYANPDTFLDSNLDYDLRQYLMFFYAFCEEQGLMLMSLVEDMVQS